MANIKEIIAEMLTEDCGTHMLDSGGAYGRHFQRNQGRDFESEKSTEVKFEIYNGKLDISMTHNVYHWLVNRLELATELDGIFHGIYLTKNGARKPEIILGMNVRDEEKCWEELAAEFPAWVAENIATEDYSLVSACPPEPKFPREPKEPKLGKTRKARKYAKAQYAKEMAAYRVKLEAARDANAKYRERKATLCRSKGIYNEGEPMTVNTYNGEDMLSQVLLYTYFTWNNEAYIVLQIHGGADVRGGYTKPRVFRADGCGDETEIFDNAKGHIFCTGKDHHPAALKRKEFQESQLALPDIHVETINFDDCNANWYTDDSCNFYPDGCCGSKYVNLEDEPCVDLQKEIDEHEGEVLEVGALVPGGWRPGVVCVLDGKAYCPKCGALLGAGE
ncbi:hypothetical protein M0R72_00790 [Candidatus Pacearchaeota archaeon]|jgi:hypothetical protein|nr:hypothetical protein [Candidatus Pacearchaeota archaeon]